MTTLITSKIEEFKEFSNFISKKDFNTNIEMFLAEHKKEFTSAELIAFKRLVRFSVKIYGLANASIRKILAAINNSSNGFGISESTFQRMKRKAIKLGILSVKPTERINGSQSTNLWIFNRFVSKKQTIDTPITEKKKGQKTEYSQNYQENTSSYSNKEQLTPLKTYINIKTNIKNIKRNDDNNKILDYTYTPSFIPEQFILAIKPYFNNARTIYKLWGKVYLAFKRYQLDYPIDFYSDIAIKALKESIFAYKQNLIKKTFIGYFFGTLKGLFSLVKRREFARKISLYDPF